MNSDDVKRIAGELSEAQRYVLKNGTDLADRGLLSSMFRIGLLNRFHGLTPLGVAVREEIKKGRV